VLDDQVSAGLAEALRGMGVRVVLDSGRVSVAREAGGLLVSLPNGEELRPEKVLFAAGRVGNTEGLALGDAGIDVDERGRIKVDGSYRTTAPGVYAAGDVLGPPALAPGERDARLVLAAETLGTTPEDIESLLWVDLAMERPIALPAGRPAETELAAFANLERIQRCVRRAHDLQLRVWDRANELVRTVARYGLIAQIRRDGEATALDVMGPLALFHSTMVYGRALAALVPLLADHPRFELDIRCELGGEQAHLKVAPPVLLPPPVVSPRRVPSTAERLARDLVALGHVVEREPPPIASGEHLLFPDLVLERDGVRRYIEVLGFSTKDYVTAKLERYRRAGIAGVVLCVDLATAPGCDLEAQVCGFTRHVDVDDLLATLGASPEHGPGP
jgi:predicted nuclease of restriction endonuclease-like RecB superfamily